MMTQSKVWIPRVLLVGKDRERRGIIDCLIGEEKNSYDLFEASDVKKALHLITDSNVDIVIIDGHELTAHGLEICRQIKQLDKKYGPVVLIVKAPEIVGDFFSDAMEAGADDLIDFPIDPLQFSVKWHLLCRLKKTESDCEKMFGDLESEISKRSDQIEESQRMAWALFNAPADAMVLLNRDKVIVDVNETTLNWFKKTRNEIIGMKATDLFDPQLAKERSNKVDLVFKSGKPYSYEDVHEGMWSDIHQYPIMGENGEVEKVAIIARDITENKLKEIQEKAQQKQLVRTERLAALGILVKGMAHEINNPNHVINMNTSILRDAWNSIEPLLDQHYNEEGDYSVAGFPYSDFKDMAFQLFDGISGSAERIRNIIDRLRDFAQFRHPQVDDSVDINDVVQSAITLLKSHIGRKTANFKTHYGMDLPVIQADSKHLEQAVVSLIRNACDALVDADQQIVVSTFHDSDTNEVCLEVIDEGVGIPEKNMTKVLNPFFTTKEDIGAVGLGLSIAARIIDEHDGLLTIDSKPNKGTSITVRLKA